MSCFRFKNGERGGERRCMKERLAGGEAFAVDASLIVADAHRRRDVAKIEDLDPTSSRAVAAGFGVIWGPFDHDPPAPQVDPAEIQSESTLA
jgi:hypothetical protein